MLPQRAERVQNKKLLEAASRLINGWVDTEQTSAALAAIGFKQEAQVERHLDIWPENVAAFGIFCRLRTQWTMGPSGEVGLNYGGLEFWLKSEAVPPADWLEVADAVQVLEFETLRLWRKKR